MKRYIRWLRAVQDRTEPFGILIANECAFLCTCASVCLWARKSINDHFAILFLAIWSCSRDGPTHRILMNGRERETNMSDSDGVRGQLENVKTKTEKCQWPIDAMASMNDRPLRCLYTTLRASCRCVSRRDASACYTGPKYVPKNLFDAHKYT